MPDRFPTPPRDSRPRRPTGPGPANLLRIADTAVGRGVFARRRIPSGIILGEIRGPILDEPPEDSSYVMELGTGRLLDPAPPFRFVNHGCDPNCEIFYWEESPDEDRLWMQTIRTIEPGEELLIDYSWPADAAIPCRCRAMECRGWIVDPAERHLLPDPPGC
ncbi:MAG: SET domain-containing protein [Planctomycetaceae bacterium]